MRSTVLSAVLSALLLLSLFSPFIVARSSLKDVEWRPIHESEDSMDEETPSPVTSAATTPFLPNPLSPAEDTWSIRYAPPTYYLINNTVDGVHTGPTLMWSVSSITNKLTSHLSHKEAEKLEKRLDRYMERLNKKAAASSLHSSNSSSGDHKEGHHKDHHKEKKHYSEVSSFYLRHAQCRACVQSNLDLLQSTSRVSLPSYQPYAVMKFCTLQTPLLPSEQAPSAENPQPLQDWEGSCIPATSDCPANTVDLNILSTSTCANDVPVTKQSCALCVLDGYEWRTHKRAVKGGDNYDGTCGPVSGSLGRSDTQWGVTVSSLDECPSVLASARSQQKFQQVSGGFFLFFSFSALLCLCLGLRRCCQVRKTRMAARLAAQSQSGVSLPVAEPIHIISASVSQPSSSYPGRVAQAQERAREVRHQAVAMQEPLLVSSGLNPPFYPSINNPPPYGYRM